jgi:protoporphyrinogen IX oxidase
MFDHLGLAYAWIKAFHIMAVIAWMAGLFYLPRLFVYDVERSDRSPELRETLRIMEERLLRVIMNPAMVLAWLLGLTLVLTPGIVDWLSVWAWLKLAGVLAMTWFHMWCAGTRKRLIAGTNRLTGRQMRAMNEVPTLLMIVIVLSVVVKF